MALARLQQASCATGKLVVHYQPDQQASLTSGPRHRLSGQPHCQNALGGHRREGNRASGFTRRAPRDAHLSLDQFAAAEHIKTQSGFPSRRQCRHVCAAFKWPWEQKDDGPASQVVDAMENREQENGKNGVPAEETDVVVVGAGLAGLACARILHAAGVPFRLLEVSIPPQDISFSCICILVDIAAV